MQVGRDWQGIMQAVTDRQEGTGRQAGWQSERGMKAVMQAGRQVGGRQRLACMQSVTGRQAGRQFLAVRKRPAGRRACTGMHVET
jgi:hypothetical protein